MSSGLARLGGESMGTSWTVQFANSDQFDLHAIHREVEDCLSLVVRQMSTWEADSEISRFNDAAANTWHKVSVEFFSVLEAALAIAHSSNGAFDPAIGGLVSLWGFGADAGERRIPSADAIEHALRSSGYARFRMEACSMSIFQPGGLRLDLSAIAKGFSVDLIGMRLPEQGIDSALIEVGGELLGVGTSPRGQAWNVLLETGADEDEALNEPRVVGLSGRAIATSGDHWFRYEDGGQTVSHSIDPRSGRPVSSQTASVSVVADSAMQADGLATALSVMGADEGMTYAKAKQLAVRFVVREANGAAREVFSPQFEALLVTA